MAKKKTRSARARQYHNEADQGNVSKRSQNNLGKERKKIMVANARHIKNLKKDK